MKKQLLPFFTFPYLHFSLSSLCVFALKTSLKTTRPNRRKLIEFYRATAKNKTRTNQTHKTEDAERNSSKKQRSETFAEDRAKSGTNQRFSATAAEIVSTYSATCFQSRYNFDGFDFAFGHFSDASIFLV